MILFVHGWGYDASLWDGVAAELPGVPHHKIDLGFFGRPDIPDTSVLQYDIAVGHSLGVLWLLHYGLAKGKTLVAVNGLTYFSARVVLELMKRGLAANTHKALADFRAACGDRHPVPTDDVDTDRLRQGLDWLGTWDGRSALAEAKAVHVLASRADRIVPREATECSFAGQNVIWHDSAQHLLPLEDPAWVARHIKAI